MKTELLKILRESDGYVSGQQLCERFHVSRTAVWKVIQQLKEEGYEVEAVKNRGYRIMTTPDVITAEEISSRLHTNWMAENCIYLESVDSTNNYAKRIAEDGTPSGTLVVADEQTGGKGRRGRSWSTPKGSNIAMTLLLRPVPFSDQTRKLHRFRRKGLRAVYSCHPSLRNKSVLSFYPG